MTAIPIPPLVIGGEIVLLLATLAVIAWALRDIFTYTPRATASPYLRRLKVKCQDHDACNN